MDHPLHLQTAQGTENLEPHTNPACAHRLNLPPLSVSLNPTPPHFPSRIFFHLCGLAPDKGERVKEVGAESQGPPCGK